MIRYYPLTRIKPNLYTRGGEFTLPNGKSYTGRYYLTYDGKMFTGINPVLGTNEPLTSVATASTSVATSTYLSAKSQNTSKNVTVSDIELQDVRPYYPIPIPDDYSQGYFTRFFAKNVSGPGYVIEISQGTWSGIQNGTLGANVLGYEVTSMLWQLTGPMYNTRISQYQIKGGVYDTNKRVTEAKAVGFVGLLAFIGGDYTKFAKLTPDVANSGSM